jgi:hypothetical protein
MPGESDSDRAGVLASGDFEYLVHFHEERNHPGLENRLIRERPVAAANDARIHRRTRLGGMLNYYQ